MPKRTIIVIGGGPAGLMAAGQAAETGADTLVLEKMNRPGRKLSITGKGRCNLTNIAELDDFIDHFGKSGRFLRQAFFAFFTPDLMEFFESQGLKLVTERGGRVFPAGGKAPEVTAALLRWARKCGVRIRRNSKVDQIKIDHGRVVGISSKGTENLADAVILTTGGVSYPATGSTGDGYRLAASAGHVITSILPALVPLVTSHKKTAQMNGLTLRNIQVAMFIDGKKSRIEFGELTFTEFGVSGPVILTLSGDAVAAIQSGRKVSLSIDLKPALNEKKLDARLLRDFVSRNREPLDSILRGLLPRELVPVCIDHAGLDPDRTASNITAKERGRLRVWLKNFRIDVIHHRPIDEAIITAGGVSTKEVNPRTMESRLVKGLYLAGEILDVQADTGGYNLQAAFSTGWLAGRSAAGGV